MHTYIRTRRQKDKRTEAQRHETEDKTIINVAIRPKECCNFFWMMKREPKIRNSGEKRKSLGYYLRLYYQGMVELVP
jgi:hypothetical protein